MFELFSPILLVIGFIALLTIGIVYKPSSTTIIITSIVLIIIVIVYSYISLNNAEKQWEKENNKKPPVNWLILLISWAPAYTVIILIILLAKFLLSLPKIKNNLNIFNYTGQKNIYKKNTKDTYVSFNSKASANVRKYSDAWT